MKCVEGFDDSLHDPLRVISLVKSLPDGLLLGSNRHRWCSIAHLTQNPHQEIISHSRPSTRRRARSSAPAPFPCPCGIGLKSVGNPKVGDRVRIERDETRYPSKGTWPQFRGKVGTVVEINRDRKRPHLTEYGTVFGAKRQRPNGSLHGSEVITWFKCYEMTALAPVSHADGTQSTPRHKTGPSRSRSPCKRPSDGRCADRAARGGAGNGRHRPRHLRRAAAQAR